MSTRSQYRGEEVVMFIHEYATVKNQTSMWLGLQLKYQRYQKYDEKFQRDTLQLSFRLQISPLR